jgi:hypothetical protein
MPIYITDEPLGLTGLDLVTISPVLFAVGLGVLTILALLAIGGSPWWRG